MKKIIVVLAVLLLVLSASACVTTPYYGAGVSYGYYTPQPRYWGYYNQPIRFTRPSYGYNVVYDPFWGLGPAVVHGIGFGLGWTLIHGLFGHHH